MAHHDDGDANVTVRKSGGKVYVAWDGTRNRASYTIDIATGHVTDNHYPTVDRSDARILKMILDDHGEHRLGEQVWLNYRNAE